jgi:hypothetical protein
VLRRTASGNAFKQFALECVEHHCELEPSPTLIGNRHAELRKAMREIGIDVERIV